MTTAEQVATEAHAGQVDKAGRPYIEHPRRVAARVSARTDDPDALAAASLHDVVEDTPVGLDELRELGFNERVLDAVDALTRRSGEGDEYYRRVAANPSALLVKRSDPTSRQHAPRAHAAVGASRRGPAPAQVRTSATPARCELGVAR